MPRHAVFAAIIGRYHAACLPRHTLRLFMLFITRTSFSPAIAIDIYMAIYTLSPLLRSFRYSLRRYVLFDVDTVTLASIRQAIALISLFSVDAAATLLLRCHFATLCLL